MAQKLPTPVEEEGSYRGAHQPGGSSSVSLETDTIDFSPQAWGTGHQGKPSASSKCSSKDTECASVVTGVDTALQQVRLRMTFMVDTEAVASSRGDRDGGSDIEPTAEPKDVRIRSQANKYLFMTADVSRQRLMMVEIDNDQEEEMERATFVLQEYYSQREGRQVSTLQHKKSGAFLAVDRSTWKPTLRCKTLAWCLFPAHDVSLRTPSVGIQPVSPDQPDSSSSSSFSSSPCSPKPDRFCYFYPPGIVLPTHLTPKECPYKTLSFDKNTNEVVTVTMPHKEDFVLQQAR